jgi:N-acetylglucosaminyldiphosphoundecaprenol N-acetyl-beta-D-mannosaminyltransferase
MADQMIINGVPCAKVIPRVNVLGVGVNAINMQFAVDEIADWIHCGEHHYICITGVHGVMESQKDERLRAIHNQAGLVTPDGMPLAWIARLRGYSNVGRVYGPDLMLEICQMSLSQNWTHYFYGGAPGVPEKLCQHLNARFQGLQVAGCFSPPYRQLTECEDEAIIQQINECAPDIVWVGLGSPKQEYWMANHEGKIKAAVMIGVGAAFDFHSGMKKQAPIWMRRIGFEWLFRLATEPRRLWRRYLVNNPTFIGLLILQELGLRKYPLK